MVEDKLIKQIQEQKISISEDDILERLLDRFRWPKNYFDGQPTIEAIKEDGTKHQNFFHEDNYLNSSECIQCYEQGYTLILSNIGSLYKGLWLIQQQLKFTIISTLTVICILVMVKNQYLLTNIIMNTLLLLKIFLAHLNG